MHIHIPKRSLHVFFLILLWFGFQTSFATPDPSDPDTLYDVRITSMEFSGGGGKGPNEFGDNYASVYYRGYGQSGTLLKLGIEMNTVPESSGSDLWQPVYGSVTITVNFTDGSTTLSFTAIASSGSNNVTVAVPYDGASGFSDSAIASGQSTLWTYSISAVAGEFCSGTISQSQTASIVWDRGDLPDDADFPPQTQSEIGVDPTATSCKIFWNPVDTTSGSFYNEDFYEYHVHFREYSDDGSRTWRTWTGTNDGALRGVENNPTGTDTDATLHFLNGQKYTTLTSLQIFTRYEAYITAVDVFGNETAQPEEVFTFTTQPFSIGITISDGITSYDDFTDLSQPELRNLRDTNIRSEIEIVSSDSQPDTVRIWFTAEPDTIDIVSASQSANSSAFPTDTLFSVDAQAVSAGTWIAFLSSDTAAIADGNSVRMVVECQLGGVSVFADKDVSDQDPNDDEWTFYIGTPASFEPWPVRILNNVITDKNPAAYPSYYLTEDAYVTIKVYDIRGRAVATILDNAFRRGGQNIKEGGWKGSNRAGRKLGVGLYYIKVKARSASSNKTILNGTAKVVIAK